MLALHFGAGNIGRGFIAPLLAQSGYDVCFVDVNQEIIEALNTRTSYEVRLAASQQETFTVQHQAGLHSINDQQALITAITKASLITTAVGPNVLKNLAPLIAEGLRARVKVTKTALNIIACENMINGSSTLKNYLWQQLADDEKLALDPLIGFVNSAVDRIVPLQSHEDVLFVEVEPFYEWVINATEVKGDRLEIAGVTYVDDLLPFIERKLFTVNTGHATCAYLGHYYGLKTIKEAINDARVRPIVQGVLQETGQLLQKKYGFEATTHQAYVDKIIKRFENEHIVDETHRVARSPLRKISANERFIKPATELLALSIAPKQLAIAVLAATKYANQDDPEAVELQSFLKTHSIAEALTKYSGLKPDNKFCELVVQAMQALK